MSVEVYKKMQGKKREGRYLEYNTGGCKRFSENGIEREMKGGSGSEEILYKLVLRLEGERVAQEK